MDELPRISAGDLSAFCQQVFEKTGLSSQDAATVTSCLVEADLRGIDSHGVSRLLDVYVRRLLEGQVNAKPNVVIVNRRGSVSLLDGDNGMGAVVGSRAMEECIEQAGHVGMACVGVRNSNHFGMTAFYTMRAAEKDLIGIAISNAPTTMAAWGGRTPMLGTNPLSIALPSRRYDPIVLDMATSEVARGKMILAAKEERPIPLGWAVDSEGSPTRDAAAALAGAVLPFGGAKGSAIALIIDVLAGVLTGARFGTYIRTLFDERPQGIGHFFGVMDVEAMMPLAQFVDRIDQMANELKAAPPAEGQEEIYLPGELEAQKRRTLMETGIPFSNAVISKLTDVGSAVGVPFPNPLGYNVAINRNGA